jgi:hypothetical protein
VKKNENPFIHQAISRLVPQGDALSRRRITRSRSAGDMPHWLSITLAFFCWLFALQQIRMALINLGFMPQPILPQSLTRKISVW